MYSPSSIRDRVGASGFGDSGLGQDTSTDSGGGWFTSLVSALPAIATTGINAYAAITQSQNLAKAGIMPTSYSASGMPIYSSPPAGVTPGNPYSLPSGYAIPPGVTPSYYTPPPQTIGALGIPSSMTMPLLLGGAALVLVVLLAGRK